MDLPILPKLKDGETFDFATLAANVEQTDLFWDWWWCEKAEEGEITRPEIISPDDPILTETIGKTTADFCRHSELFDRLLHKAIQEDWLPRKDHWPREPFWQLALRRVSCCTANLAGTPQIVFTGGGYGSGKTTVVNYLAKNDVLPVKLEDMVGVDLFKPLIPEYNLIKAVGDGRASLTVQKECQALGEELFELLLPARRSFIWDSSMSNEKETLSRIESAKAAGYELTMVAVLTDVEIAKKRAMERAKVSRRFPHPQALPKSHEGFRAAFKKYVPLFDRIVVLSNDGGPDDCSVIAEQPAGTKHLALYDREMFVTALGANNTP